MIRRVRLATTLGAAVTLAQRGGLIRSRNDGGGDGGWLAVTLAA